MAHNSLSQKIKAIIYQSKDVSALAFKRVVLLHHQHGVTNAPRHFNSDQGGHQYDKSTASASSTFYAQQNGVPLIGGVPYNTV